MSKHEVDWTVAFELDIVVVKQDGLFTARTTPFAITVYGNTAEEAETKAEQAVRSLLGSYSTPDRSAQMVQMLDRRHVEYATMVHIE